MVQQMFVLVPRVRLNYLSALFGIRFSKITKPTFEKKTKYKKKILRVKSTWRSVEFSYTSNMLWEWSEFRNVILKLFRKEKKKKYFKKQKCFEAV